MRRLAIVGLVFAARAHAAPEVVSVSPDDDSMHTASDDAFQPVTVKSRLDGTIAVFDAHYVFHHAGPGLALNFAELAIPGNGVVTGGSITVDGTRHVLALGPAAVLDDELANLAASDPGVDPVAAVVIHLRDRFAIVDLAIPHATDITLDLSLSTPTCLFRDIRFAAVPVGWKIGRPDDDVTDACDPREVSWQRFATTELASAPDRVGIVGGRLVASSTHLARVEIDVSRVLADTPADLATAIVVDSSRSLTPRQVDVQREIALAYLRLVPRSRVQVIATARTARPLLPGWMPVESVLPRIDREMRGLALRNGSNVDAGIAEAERWLARIAGTHRIIVLGDGRLPHRLDDHLPTPHSLTHIVELDDGAAGLTRIDDGPLAAVAAATTGVAVRGGLAGIDATILVRPVTLDAVAITGAGWKPIEPEVGTCADTIDAGHSCTWWGTGTAVSSPIVVEGLLWNRKISRIVQLDPRHAPALARELSVIHPLEGKVQEAVDRAAHALTTTWSLGARWGGRTGYGELAGAGFDGIDSMSTVGTRGRSIMPTIGSVVIHKLDLTAQLSAAYARCHADNHRVVIDLETTRQEIVDVTVVVSPRLVETEPKSALAALHDCLVEAVWDTTLVLTDGLEHADRHVALGP